MQIKFTAATTTTHQAGDTVVFSDPNDDDLGRCGTVARVHRSRRVGSLQYDVIVFVETSDGENFHGFAHDFHSVNRFES